MSSVSMILPFYNAGNLVERTFQQLRKFDESHIQIILIDDSSTDNTFELVERFGLEQQNVTVIRSETNLGPGGARNLGLRAATSDYVWFVDWDDQWNDDFTRILLKAAALHDADMVICRARWRLSNGLDLSMADGIGRTTVATGAEAFDNLLDGSIRGYLWNKLIRRSLLGIDPFPEIRTQEDLCGIASVLPRCERVVFIPDVLYFHVVREGSITNSRNPPLENLEYSRDIVLEIAQSLPHSSRRRKLATRFALDTMLSIVGTALRLSSSQEGRRRMDEVRREISFRHALATASVDPKLAAKALAVKVLGFAYPWMRSRYVQLRGLVRVSRTRSQGAS